MGVESKPAGDEAGRNRADIRTIREAALQLPTNADLDGERRTCATLRCSTQLHLHTTLTVARRSQAHEPKTKNQNQNQNRPLSFSAMT